MSYSNGKFDGKAASTGWGVFRNSPWHFIGLYSTESEAKAVQAKHGDEYEVQYGDYESGTDNFLHSTAP